MLVHILQNNTVHSLQSNIYADHVMVQFFADP